jgi:hypothetical protein
VSFSSVVLVVSLSESLILALPRPVSVIDIGAVTGVSTPMRPRRTPPLSERVLGRGAQM